VPAVPGAGCGALVAAAAEGPAPEQALTLADRMLRVAALLVAAAAATWTE